MRRNPFPFEDSKDLCYQLLCGHFPELLVDYDGTLSELRSDPGNANIDLGCLESLTKLSSLLPLVGIISEASGANRSDLCR